MRRRAIEGAPWFWLSWAGALAVGTVLRLYRLSAQVLVGDEIHAVRAVVSTPLPEILYRYGITDHCLPLSGLARLLLERGVQLSEATFRGPVVVAGLALLALLPLVVRRAASPGAAAVFPWLLALSPELVLYGRVARSYTPAALLALGAVVAFFAWWRGRGWGFGAAYAVLGALAVYFHLVVAPFVAAPLGFGALVRLVAVAGREGRGAGRRRGEPGVAGLVLAGVGLAVGLAAFLVPGWESLSGVLAAKGGRSEIRLDTLSGAIRLLAGSASWPVAVLFWCLVARGLVVLARRERELALYGAFAVVVQVGSLWVLAPFGIANPVIFARYLMVTLPVVLLWLAHGVVARRGAWTGVLAGLLLVVLFAAGPFVSPRFRTSSFVHHDDFLAFHRPLPTLRTGRIPRFYERLGETPGDGAVIELPTYPEGSNRVLHLYQDRHRRQVLEVTPEPTLNDPHLDFRNRVRPAPEAILRSRARYLVVHRDLEAEELAVEVPRRAPHAWGRRQRNLSERFRQIAGDLADRLVGLWGEPDVDDGTILVWDLERVRSSAEGGSEASTPGP